jgi:hypothetical protein
LQEQAARIRERYVATVAHKKPHVELIFQLPDLAAQRRHGDVQLLRSFREAEMFCDRDEIA